MILPWLDIAELAYDAGFRGEPLSIAIALTAPESGRNTEAVNQTDPSGGSFGLWQINGVHKGSLTVEEFKAKMFIPEENAKMAFGIWKSNAQGINNFKPWGAFTSNLHLPHLPVARAVMYAREEIARQEVQIKSLSLSLDEAKKYSNSLTHELIATENTLDETEDKLELAQAEVTNLNTTLTAYQDRFRQINSLSSLA